MLIMIIKNIYHQKRGKKSVKNKNTRYILEANPKKKVIRAASENWNKEDLNGSIM